MIRWLLTVLMVAASSLWAAETLPGKWLEGKLSAGDGEREYMLYVPSSYRGEAAPLVVMLHGCNQSPEVFAQSTRMNQYAETGRFLVLYPAQKIISNPTRCWNWFLPENQRRDSGEPAQIIATIDQVARQYAVDRKRVYVAGLSAGASMSAILAACYPDVFAAAGIADGTMYGSATSLTEATKVMATGKTPDPTALGTKAWECGGKRNLLVPVTVWHGRGDNIVNLANGEKIVQEFAELNDLADDGKGNNSVPGKPKTQSGRVKEGYSYTVASYDHGGRPLIQYWQVDKMGHAWSGGTDKLMFSDAKGPDASLQMWNFFRQYSR